MTDKALVVVITLEESPTPAVPSQKCRCHRCDAQCWISLSMKRTMQARGPYDTFCPKCTMTHVKKT